MPRHNCCGDTFIALLANMANAVTLYSIASMTSRGQVVPVGATAGVTNVLVRERCHRYAAVVNSSDGVGRIVNAKPPRRSPPTPQKYWVMRRITSVRWRYCQPRPSRRTALSRGMMLEMFNDAAGDGVWLLIYTTERTVGIRQRCYRCIGAQVVSRTACVCSTPRLAAEMKATHTEIGDIQAALLTRIQAWHLVERRRARLLLIRALRSMLLC